MRFVDNIVFAANEVCDRFASAGFHSNLISYLTQELNMPLVAASNTLTNFGGTSSFTPLIGALCADSFAGRFWTITVGCLIYELVSYLPFHNINLMLVS
jgi:peptide/histidine transporter 3/4